MLRLEFHTGIEDPLAYCCRLLRKAYRQRLKVLVCGEPEQLNRLDTLLWTFEQLEFVPHARLRGAERPDAALLPHTPIWLADATAAWPEPDVVVNLGEQPLAEPSRFARVVELVGADTDARQAGRSRWRHYAGLGLAPQQVSAAAAPDEAAAP